MIAEDLLKFCRSGYNQPDHQPVINLKGHAVVLDSYHRYEDELVMITIDSAVKGGERGIQCSIKTENGQQELDIGEKVDQWCLASDKCYYICFN